MGLLRLSIWECDCKVWIQIILMKLKCLNGFILRSVSLFVVKVLFKVKVAVWGMLIHNHLCFILLCFFSLMTNCFQLFTFIKDGQTHSTFYFLLNLLYDITILRELGYILYSFLNWTNTFLLSKLWLWYVDCVLDENEHCCSR